MSRSTLEPAFYEHVCDRCGFSERGEEPPIGWAQLAWGNDVRNIFSRAEKWDICHNCSAQFQDWFRFNIKLDLPELQ